MPNWCENIVRISGDKEEIARFRKETDDMQFNKILPIPNNKWDYDWCCDNWGTKWSVAKDQMYVSDEYGDGDSVCYEFDTAWSPPEGIFNAIEKKYDVNISWFYHEPGLEIAGYLKSNKNRDKIKNMQNKCPNKVEPDKPSKSIKENINSKDDISITFFTK